MSAETLLAVFFFALSASMTPGPNNVMLLASGANFGFRRTIPHMLGVTIGFAILLLAIGAGLGALLTAFPALSVVLRVVGGLYLLYLAYRIATARSVARAESAAVPLSFLKAAAFQWVNPKAWVMAATAMALYTDPSRPSATVLIVTLLFMAVSLLSTSTWSGFGAALRDFLADPVRLKWFNIVMGVLLAATVVPLVA